MNILWLHTLATHIGYTHTDRQTIIVKRRISRVRAPVMFANHQNPNRWTQTSLTDWTFMHRLLNTHGRTRWETHGMIYCITLGIFTAMK